jgi:hypothetical protein
MLKIGVLMLHDNTHPHVASTVQNTLSSYGFHMFSPSTKGAEEQHIWVG